MKKIILNNIFLTSLGSFIEKGTNGLSHNRIRELLILNKMINKFNNDESTTVEISEFIVDKYELIQNELQVLNEFSDERKSNGVYYTPNDITEYIIVNSLCKNLLKDFDSKIIATKKQFVKHITSLDVSEQSQLIKSLLNLKIIDPTCGTGAFIVDVFSILVYVLKSLKYNFNYGEIIKCIYGNDIDGFSLEVCEIRLALAITYFGFDLDYEELKSIFRTNISVQNVLELSTKQKFDIVIGNPPYIERSKIIYKNLVEYGNIYADVLKVSVELLHSGGIMGMIVPISYVSTKRMSGIREFISRTCSYQNVLSYSDRPDCLFVNVHQKLNIIFAMKKEYEKPCKLFTSDYKYWYKSERKSVFRKQQLINNPYVTNDMFPKLEFATEINIYKKIIKYNKNIFDLQCTPISKSSGQLYLSKRATFWIKSFIKEPENLNEYMSFNFDKDTLHMMNCLLNSSLFWWFWIKVSDCWHITNKELSLFKVYFDNDLGDEFKKLSLTLSKELEITKKEVNTKQTKYEYKHKLCLKEINKIDDLVSKYYMLTKYETNFIKKYKINYRMSNEKKSD